jgi:hypothetical protein
MPLAFSSILTSSVTLISTSTNLVVSGLLRQYKMEPMGMFELAPVGITIAIVGLAYVYFARHWIPDRAHNSDLLSDFGMRPYLSELMISPIVEDGRANGRASGVREGSRRKRHSNRSGQNEVLLPNRALKLEANDVLLVEGKHRATPENQGHRRHRYQSRRETGRPNPAERRGATGRSHPPAESHP